LLLDAILNPFICLCEGPREVTEVTCGAGMVSDIWGTVCWK